VTGNGDNYTFSVSTDNPLLKTETRAADTVISLSIESPEPQKREPGTTRGSINGDINS